MSILLSVNPPFAGWLVDGEKTIEWRKKPLPVGKAYIYETKKNGGCGMVIGEVAIWDRYQVYDKTLSREWVAYGKVGKADLERYSKGEPFYGNLVEKAKRYEKPIPLSEFRFRKKIRGYHKQGENFAERLLHGGRVEVKQITRPPQSWCYVEDLEGETK